MIRKTILAASAAAAFLAALPAHAATYVIDSENAHASVNFEAPHLGFSYIAGRFNAFEGQFEFDPANPEASSIEVKVDPASVDTNLAARDNHLRSGDFLATGEFPDATFKSTSVKVTGENTAEVTGSLTFRGVSRAIAVKAEFVGAGKDPWGGERAGFRGETEITLGDFGVEGDFAGLPVKLVIHVEGVRK